MIWQAKAFILSLEKVTAGGTESPCFPETTTKLSPTSVSEIKKGLGLKALTTLSRKETLIPLEPSSTSDATLPPRRHSPLFSAADQAEILTNGKWPRQTPDRDTR
ncbi:hypothetical protein PIB30_009175 [Stylosanthes scabra]|uniref:Uncharacterized protein n=1 Tax=Stylosanthes scabra TaxID=79078 RepID=A0ABU6Y4H7_9FABA|nr:hypothetical protein [Stylosanthes scabra]